MNRVLVHLGLSGDRHGTLSPDDFTPAGLDFGGSPLSFGYARRTTADSQGTRLTLEHSIEHFRITIVPK